MFCPPTEEDIPPTNKRQYQNSRPRRKRRPKPKNLQHALKQSFKKKNKQFALNMATWAESYTFAATWQLKHQLAFWKAKAKALEYENSVLHNIIRKKHYVQTGSSTSNTESHASHIEDCDDGSQDPVSIYEDEAGQYKVNEEQEQGEDFEVSEEFIEFLRTNAKYKEDARIERERLKAKEAEENIQETEPAETLEERQNKLKELYGSHWQRISALETYSQSLYIEECDKLKPVYWPNIPLNFNFN